MKLSPLLLGTVLIVGSLGLVGYLKPTQEAPMLGHGRVENLESAYQRWQQVYEKHGGDHQLIINLTYTKAYSSEFTSAKGQLRLDLKQGHLYANVKGLQPARYTLWLLASPSQSGAGKGIALGEMQVNGNEAKLEAALSQAQLAGFSIHQAAIATTGSNPRQAGLLFGTPGLFQRYYHTQRLGMLAHLDNAAATTAVSGNPFDFLLPTVAQAHGGGGTTFKEKIEHGREIFVNETFNGNGRTCATCHRPQNNHTIDPKFIAKLDKKDPLFIAEYDLKLKNLEKPKLLREMGLVLTNVDGFDKPPIMRAVPHLLALTDSVIAEQELIDSGFANATGWSGDGAPGDGSLRMFAIGAVKQHMPKTLNRKQGKDFRLPTEDELDDMEAYLLSLGRAEDINLEAMTFYSPIVERGHQLYNTRDVDGTGKCAGCHYNGGSLSNSTFGNPLRDTGVENMPDNPAMLLDNSVAYDGGFGRQRRTNCGPQQNAVCYGDGRFNSTTVIESVDTAPYFHNHSVSTLEEAIAFYNTDEFNSSPGSFLSDGKPRKIKLTSTQVTEIGLFLRTLSAMENIRSSDYLSRQAIDSKTVTDGRRLIKLAIADTRDAIEVMAEGAILAYPEALNKLKKALGFEQAAYESEIKTVSDALLEKASILKVNARNLMVEEL